jgi:excisionase family DNA binding protein
MAVIGTTEAAKRLKLTVGRIRTMIGSGLLPAQKVGRDWLIDEADLEAFAKIERKPGRPRKKKR